MLDTQRKLAVVTGAPTEIGLRERMPFDPRSPRAVTNFRA